LLADVEGNFYGTTNVGGANSRGTVFKLSPDNTETVLYSFGIDGTPFCDLVVDAQSNLYGTLGSGGTNNAGLVFKLTPDGQYSTVYDFGSFPGDGVNPSDRLMIDRHGNFSGTTVDGGARDKGTIFKIKPGATAEVSLLSR
jgi:uncharacterized repeat protein (TIGR03803 family)